MDEQMTHIIELLERHHAEFLNIKNALASMDSVIRKLQQSTSNLKDTTDSLNREITALGVEIEYLRYSIPSK